MGKIEDLNKLLRESEEKTEKIRAEWRHALIEQHEETVKRLLKHHKFPYRVGLRVYTDKYLSLVNLEVYDGDIAKEKLTELLRQSGISGLCESVAIWQVNPVIWIHDPKVNNE
jgi:hypothetical protein